MPARSARIGPVDRIFTRIGAGDDLAGGRSTFMVEMTEAANILHNASQHSLVLLDEIGRGTGTYDGMALAWAAAVELATRIRAFTLFATHYFELTALPEHYPGIANVHLEVREHGDQRRVPAPRASRARPAAATACRWRRWPVCPAHGARRAPARCWRGSNAKAATRSRDPTTRRSACSTPPGPDPLRERLAALDPDSMTPAGGAGGSLRAEGTARGIDRGWRGTQAAAHVRSDCALAHVR